MKRTLQEIKRPTGITTKAIADRAKLPTGDVHVVLIGGRATWKLAQKVVDAFNELSGMNIGVADISFVAPPSEYDLPLFYDLWKRYCFDSSVLAKKAGVREQVILTMFQNEEVTRATAEQVLAALSTLIPYQCSLQTVRVTLNREEVRNARNQKGNLQRDL